MKNNNSFLKKYLGILSFCLVATFAKGQTEIKSSPIALLLEVANIGIEQVITDDWGAEFDFLAGRGTAYGIIAAKHYFGPKFGADGFNVGLFVGAGLDLGVGAGFLAGYKWYADKGVLFEIGAGIGRGTAGFLPYGKIALGYRFDRDNGQKKQRE